MTHSAQGGNVNVPRLSDLGNCCPRGCAYHSHNVPCRVRRGRLVLAAAGARLATELGLPPLNPAERLYRLLIEHGRPAPTDAYSGPVKARAAVAWLPAALRAPVLDVLVAGKRLAQEAVGRELLTRVNVRSLSGYTSR